LGHTITSVLIKASTIDAYTRHVGQFLTQHYRQVTFTDTPILDPRFTPHGLCHELKCILAEVEKWECRPKKANPLTKAMLDHLISTTQNTYPHGCRAVTADWLIVGLYCGLRLSEYCQYSSNANRGSTLQNLDGEPTAFIARDFRFFIRDKHEIPHAHAFQLPPSAISSVNITWRRQKNSQVDQDRTLIRDDNNPHRCPLRAILRILRRAHQLDLPPLHPVCVYLAPNGSKSTSFRLLNDLEIRDILRELAKTVHEVNDPIELSKYTTHSVRVGACVILFLANVPKDIIKFCLRWLGESWREYLRHLPVMAAQQINAINTTDAFDYVKTSNSLPIMN
jgi:hypothetical protein